MTGLDIYRVQSRFIQSFRSLRCITILDEIYSQLPGSKIDLNSLSRPIGDLKWQKKFPSNEPLPPENIFSCIAYFETGYLDIDPDTLKENFALSCHDSLYVSHRVLLDPFVSQPRISVTRMIGNIGKPGLSFLISPAEPRVLELGPESWKVVAHEPFDGKLQDCFTSTSLHLSLTGYKSDIAAAEPGRRGACEPDARMIEATISLHDRGKWIADLDILRAEKERKKRLVLTSPECTHTTEERLDTSYLPPLVSVENWYEFLDPPTSDCIVHVHKNAMARLAAVSLAFQRSHKFSIVSPDACWLCIGLRWTLGRECMTLSPDQKPIDKVYALDAPETRYWDLNQPKNTISG